MRTRTTKIWMRTTSILIRILMSCNWMVATITLMILTSMNGLQVSSTILSGGLAELSVYYALQTNVEKAFVCSSKTEINEIGSMERRAVNIFQSKFPSYNF
jgi:hypothetical protein